MKNSTSFNQGVFLSRTAVTEEVKQEEKFAFLIGMGRIQMNPDEMARSLIIVRLEKDPDNYCLKFYRLVFVYSLVVLRKLVSIVSRCIVFQDSGKKSAFLLG